MKFNQISNSAACPVSFEQVDNNLIKIYSGFVLTMLLTSLIVPCQIGVYLITIDFIIRVFIGIKYSPLCKIITKSIKIVALKQRLVDSGRKRIAAQVGLLFSVLISLSFLAGLSTISTVLTLMFIIAIALDLIFDYCLACKLQTLFNTYFKK
jgi:hypothetical protein